MYGVNIVESCSVGLCTYEMRNELFYQGYSGVNVDIFMLLYIKWMNKDVDLKSHHK